MRAMIRTRDLVIFVAVLLFLLLCIAITLVRDIQFTSQGLPFDLGAQDGEESFTATGEKKEINREDIITRLRNALAQNDPAVEVSPSVEETTEITSEDLDAVEAENDATAGVLMCGGDDAESLARSWPLSGVSFVTQESLRSVVHADVSAPPAQTTATGTAAVASKTLIVLPLTAYPAASPSCLPSEVVGITTTGSLMYNNEASFYKGYGAEYLIGYARDGFPIYGYYQGEVDACGGYVHASGYRYTVSPDREYLIGCYIATPSSFVVR
jgi:hypothetical protein